MLPTSVQGGYYYACFTGKEAAAESTCQCRRQELRVGSQGWEEPPEEDMATHSSIIAWKVQWTDEPGGLQSMGSQKSQTWLRDWTHTGTFRKANLPDITCVSENSLASHCGSEKAMATHSSTLTWKISWMEEPGRLQSMGSLRVRHDWATSLSVFTFMHWRRKWQPTPVFLPGESQGWWSLVGCCLCCRTESDMTEVT